MYRRTFLQRLGIGSAAAVSGATIGGGFVAANHDTFPPRLLESVAPRSQTGQAAIWWSVDTDERAMALTFDDGPLPRYTEPILDLLDEHAAKATFFMLGALVETYPELARRVVERGHEAANHSHEHVSAIRRDRDFVISDIARANEVIERTTGQPARFFRPPRGETTTATLLAVSELRLDLVFWSAQRGKRTIRDDDVNGVRDHLIASASPGAIIDLHDGIGTAGYDGTESPDLVVRRDTELAALPAVLEAWGGAGYRLLTLSELVASHRSR